MVKRQQWILVCCGFFLLFGLYFFGTTIAPIKKSEPPSGTNTQHEPAQEISSEKLIIHAKEKLNAEQLQLITSLENSVKRGDIKNQQLKAFKQLATFWGDSIHLFEPYAYYTAEAAKLENSEKNLTFAAHLFLNNLKTEQQTAMQHWLATNAKDLFNRAIAINPANDSSKIGLGACYIFGNLSDNPMEGISLIREVVQRNPDNMFGQFILGLGGVKSGQFDKAIERFKIVLAKEPNNLEAMLNLAEIYDRKGEKPDAVKWYKQVKGQIDNPEAQKELDTRIKALQ